MGEAKTLRRNLTAQLRGLGAAKLIDAMPSPAILVDAEARVMFANAPADELLPALRIGEPLVLALRAPDVIDAIRRVAGGGEPETALWSERVPIERLFQVDVAPLATELGEVVAMLLTLRDLTEARRVERMRADFIANASHELRTPLASLLGFIETLQGPAQSDAKARAKFLRHHARAGPAHGAADRRSAVAVAHRAEAASAPGGGGRPEPDRPPRRRHAGAAGARDERRAGARCRRDHVMVVGERDELVRVAENLIENAIKYGAQVDGRLARRDRGRAPRQGGRAHRARPRPRHRA